ncbi:MAG: two-component sensor histidine kinase, partial [Saprospiraceae bacterium]
MKIFVLTFCLALAWNIGYTQEDQIIDSLKHELFIATADSTRVMIMASMSNRYIFSNSDSTLMYGQRALNLAQQIKFLKGEARALFSLAVALRIQGDLPKALEMQFKGLQIAEDKHYLLEIGRCLMGIGGIYDDLKDYPKMISFFQRAQAIYIATHNEASAVINALGIAEYYRLNNHLDSALSILQKVYNKINLLYDIGTQGRFFMEMGVLQFELGNHHTAFEHLRKSIQLLHLDNNHRLSAIAYNSLAHFFKEINQPDSTIYYARKGLAEGQAIGFKREILKSSSLLADLYESKDLRQAYYYRNLAMSTNDEMFGANKVLKLQKIVVGEQQRQREIEANNISFHNRLKQYALLSGLAVFLLIAFILYRSNHQKQKDNVVLEKTLGNLKSTQAQLIQSEKMASLGELTAGIAHEIQNP